MTYEEVESQLGKPTAIERGVNQLEVVYSKISSEIAQCRNRKNLLLVKYKHCVLFEASSGRVVEKGYFPYSVNNIN